MHTKYPQTDNKVTRARRRQRGIALVSVIAVLVLLTMVATPFVMTMNDSRARGEKFLYSSRADAEAQALFETVRSQLITGLENVERRQLGDVPPASVAAAVDPPPEATPTWDTPVEMTMPKAVMDRFNVSTAKEHRVWAADITDAQAVFNINNCSYGVLANILGRAQVTAPTTADTQTIPLDHVPDSFPKADGIVRIGSECIKYKQIVGNALVNCERGALGNLPGNGPAEDLEPGDAVMLESCYQIATRPYRLRPGAWVHYTHVDQARTIGDLGVAALPPQDFERLRPYITAWSGNAVGDGWANPQLVHNGISAGEKKSLYAQLKNVRYFGPGTMVRITDGVNYDYAIVAKVKGTDQIELVGKIDHDYQPDQTRIYCLARSPINVNTADVSTLSLVFQGLRMRGKTAYITERQADELAAFLKTWRRPPPTGAAVTPSQSAPGVFRDWDDLTKALESARDAGKIDQDGFQAVLLNAMNANDSTLGYSTVPFVFRSYDIYEVRATVSIQGANGIELARRELRRVMEVSSTRSGTFVVETQDEFQNQIIKSRDAKWTCTFPVNVNAQYDGKNIPSSEYKAYAQKDLFPSSDRSSGVGDVQLLPASFRFTTGNRKDDFEHFDEERIPDGFEIKDKTFQLSVDNPFDPPKGTLDLVDTVSIPNLGDNLEVGVKEFACSFWYRPEWERGSGDHVIFDYGDNSGTGSDTMNRIVLAYEKRRDALILAVADATREQRLAEVVYKFDHSTWIAKEWYHIACHVHGCGPGMIQLWVDGEQAGRPNHLTHLASTVPSAGATATLQVVDDTEDFPDSGVLLVRGKDGMELMEYKGKPNDKSFQVTRRRARSISHTIGDTVQRTFSEGDTVELYGFTGPLLSDIKKGGATTDGQLGLWRCYRMVGEPDSLSDGTQTVMKGLATPAPGGTQPAKQTVALAEWDTGSTDPSVLDDLGPPGTAGIAALMSNAILLPNTTPMTVATAGSDPSLANTQQSPNRMGGVDIVQYVVSQTPGSVDIVKRGLALKHFKSNLTDQANGGGLPRFFPSHEYGETGQDNIVIINGNNQIRGAITAFIPIGVLAQGASGAEYLDPISEPQLKSSAWPLNPLDTNLHDGHAFIQVEVGSPGTELEFAL